jgi:hypothetical protein
MTDITNQGAESAAPTGAVLDDNEATVEMALRLTIIFALEEITRQEKKERGN